MVTVGRILALSPEEWAEADSRGRDGPYWSRCDASQVPPRRGEVVQGREAAQLPRKTLQVWGIPSKCPPPFAQAKALCCGLGWFVYGPLGYMY